EGGVLGGRPDEREQAALDVGQQEILLPLIEAVDLVDEQQRPSPRALALVGGLYDLAKAWDTLADRVERDERGAHRTGEQPAERRLSTSGRTVEDDAGDPPALLEASHEALAPHERLLPDDLVQAPRPHPF